MAVIDVGAKVDATDYGDLGDGGDTGQAAIREIWFGPVFAGSNPYHFDMQNLMVGTTGFGSSDLWNPGALTGLGDFDAFYGPGSDPSFGAGVMSFNNTDGDRYGVHILGTDYALVYVTFDLRVFADNTANPIYTAMSESGGAAAETMGDGLYDTGSIWVWNGPGVAFGSGAIRDGTTWETVSLLYSYPPPSPFTLDATPNTVSIFVGGSGSSTITSTLVSGSPESISLAITTSLPTGVSYSFTPSSISDDGGTSTLDLFTTGATPAGTYPLVVLGDDGSGGTATTTVTLVVSSQPGFHIAS
jgi:hypothetical protein